MHEDLTRKLPDAKPQEERMGCIPFLGSLLRGILPPVRDVVKPLRDLAEATGGRLSFTDHNANIIGSVTINHAGIDLIVKHGTTVSRMPQAFAVVEATAPASQSFYLKLGDQNFLHDIRDKFGYPDIQLGIPRLDEKMNIKSSHPEIARALALDSEIQQIVLDPRYSGIVVSDHQHSSPSGKPQLEIHQFCNGEVYSAQDLLDHYRRCCRVVDKLIDAGIIVP